MTKYIFPLLLLTVLVVACSDEEKDIPAPTIYLKMPENGFDIDRDSSFSIEPKITYDVDGSYEWILNGKVAQKEKILKFNKDEYGDFLYTFKVSTKFGQSKMNIPVHSLDITFFEYPFELNKNGYNNNPENGIFKFEYVNFPTKNNGGTDANWSGFALSKNTNQTNAKIENEFSVYNKTGADESKRFMVFKYDENNEHRISFDDNEEHTIRSIEVTNSTVTYLSLKNNLDKDKEVDFYLLTVTGYDAANNKTGSVDHYLADYRDKSITSKVISASWKPVNLTSLGKVNSIKFDLVSSLDANTQISFPKYLCIDNMKVED